MFLSEIVPERINVLGVGISALSLDQAVEILDQAAETSSHLGYVTVTGVHGVMESQADLELKKIHNQSFLSTPDGMPMVWLGKHSGAHHMTRVYGPDLFKAVLEKGLENNRRHFFFGGNDGVANELKEKMIAKYNDLEVCGFYTPPFRPLEVGEEQDLLQQVIASKPHYLWVGLSTPKQEIFMSNFISKYRDRLLCASQGLTLLGVGAVFDFYTGRVKQAPRWVQKSGLEWAFRLCMEPRRLWRRYIFNNTRFCLKIFPQMMDLKIYPLSK